MLNGSIFKLIIDGVYYSTEDDARKTKKREDLGALTFSVLLILLGFIQYKSNSWRWKRRK